MLLWAACMPMAANAQRSDCVRMEHEVKLDEVVVTGLTGTAALKNMPMPMSVVTNKELRQTSATNIIDAVMHSHPLPPLGTMQGGVSTEYQTNNGLFAYTVNAAGNADGFVWSSRWSQKLAHAYKDGNGDYVCGTQFAERAFTQLLGLNKGWGVFAPHAVLLSPYAEPRGRGQRESWLRQDCAVSAGVPL